MHELYEIYWKGRKGVCNKICELTKFAKTAKFTIIRLSIHEIYEIFWKGYTEVPTEIYQNYEFYEIS